MEQFAQEVRSKAKWGPAVDVNVRGLMASGAMAGQPVHIQLKHKDPVYLQGGTLHLCSSPSGFDSPDDHHCLHSTHNSRLDIRVAH